ncbi:MAG: hypothetical protein ABSE85_15100 [Candidatus Korobacteraceae bacterium]
MPLLVLTRALPWMTSTNAGSYWIEELGLTTTDDPLRLMEPAEASVTSTRSPEKTLVESPAACPFTFTLPFA